MERDAAAEGHDRRVGQRELTAGKHRLTLDIIGANDSKFKAYMVGLDYIRLKAR